MLEGVPLPASKQELMKYAREQQDGALVGALEQLPHREYQSLDDVGEALLPVQPEWPQPDPHEPRQESDLPPGGDDYTRPHPESGGVRPSAPPRTPPQQTLEQQTKAQKRQKERQKQLG